MTLARVGESMGVDHATILHGNRKTVEKLNLGYSDYTDTMLNWRFIFDDNQLDITKDISGREKIKARIINLLTSAVIDGAITRDERDGLLTEVLESFSGKEELLDVEGVY